MYGNPDVDIIIHIVQLLRERIEQGLLTIFINFKAHRDKLADRWADDGRQSENIRWSLPTNRPIFYWTDNDITHHSPMNPTIKKRIDFQVSQQQFNIHSGSTANFLTREDSSRDLQANSIKIVVYGYEPDEGCYNASLINFPVRYNSSNGAY